MVTVPDHWPLAKLALPGESGTGFPEPSSAVNGTVAEYAAIRALFVSRAVMVRENPTFPCCGELIAVKEKWCRSLSVTVTLVVPEAKPGALAVSVADLVPSNRELSGALTVNTAEVCPADRTSDG